jgi:hypothetical protein
MGLRALQARGRGNFSRRQRQLPPVALDLVAQWSDPREHQFQKVITAERNRVRASARNCRLIRANSG